MSDSGEVLLPLLAGDPNDPAASVLHRAPGGEVTVQQYPGLADVHVALREDGLGLLFARRSDGQAVAAWKPPGQPTFGEPAPMASVPPARMTFGSSPDAGRKLPPFLRPQPGLGFSEGAAVMVMRDGDAAEVRTALPYLAFGPPARIGPATDRSGRPRLDEREGHMIASWDSGLVFPSQSTLYAAVKAPGRGFEPATRVAQGVNLNFPPASVGRNGQVMAVWSSTSPIPQPSGVLFPQQAAERRAGTSGFRPVAVPAELTGSAVQAQFDSTGTAVLGGSSAEPQSVDEPNSPPKPGFWTWSRAPDGTLAGPDLVSTAAYGGTFLLDGRGGGVALGRGAGLRSVLIFDYNEAASLGRNRPVLSALRARRGPSTARTAARPVARTFLTLRLTKTARVKLRFDQLGRAGVVRVRCPRQARRRGKTCKRRRAVAGWRTGQVGANNLALSRTARRLLRRPGLYRVTARPRDSRGRYGRARSVRVRVKR